MMMIVIGSSILHAQDMCFLQYTVLISCGPVCTPMPSRHIYVAERCEERFPISGFCREIYTVLAAGNSS